MEWRGPFKLNSILASFYILVFFCRLVVPLLCLNIITWLPAANIYCFRDVYPLRVCPSLSRMPFQSSTVTRYLRVTKASQRTPWRKQRPRRVSERSQAEKASLAKMRAERKDSYQAALAAAYDVLMQEAVKLRDQFGTHSVMHYFEAIIHVTEI